MFSDRIDAGTRLAALLKDYQGVAGVALAVPRGGVPVAYAVAKELGLPLNIVLIKKIGHPLNKEYAIGAVSLTDFFVIPHKGVEESYVSTEVENIRQRLKDMYQTFMGDNEPEPLENKIVIVIDDGMATGNTLLGTVQMLRRNKPSKIIVAVPVASESAVDLLSKAADEVVAVLVPEYFTGVGTFYEDFSQVEDDEVIYYLDKWKREVKKAG